MDISHLVTFMILFIVHKGSSLQCHHCTGIACQDPFEPDPDYFLTGLCNVEYGYCVKDKTHNHGFVLTTRFCYSSNDTHSGCETEPDSEQERCYCDTDKCNSSLTLHTQGFKHLVITFIAVSIIRLMK